MTKLAMASSGLLQESLLGRVVTVALALEKLEAELKIACQTLVSPLQRLYLGDSTALTSAPELTAEGLVARMITPLQALHTWVLQPQPMANLPAGPVSLRDFWHLVLMTRSLAELSGQTPPTRLLHLLGIAKLKARLEQHVGAVNVLPAYLTHDVMIQGLNASEVAALCSLKLSTVRNAISRREMPSTKQNGVAFDEALDWMVQRSGFLYPYINAATRDRRINGRLAAEWLAASNCIVFERTVSRLRLSIWRLAASGHRVALNAEGVRSCVLLLPRIDISLLVGVELDDVEDRSEDPAAAMHREALDLSSGEPLWQCQVPTMGVLDDLLARLSCRERWTQDAPTLG